MNDLPNSSHLRNFVNTDDIADIFKAQLKQIKKDQLFEDRSSLTMLKNYLAEAILIMVCYFVRKIHAYMLQVLLKCLNFILLNLIRKLI